MLRRSILLGMLVLAMPATAQGAAPLDPLSTAEIKNAFRIVEADARFPAGGYFPTVTLDEPPKAEVLAWSPGDPFRREAFANVYDRATNKLFEVIVDLRAERVVSWTRKAGLQPPIYQSEWSDADAAVRADPRWQDAMRRRGINPDDVYNDIWAPGEPNVPPAPAGARVLRALTFWKGNLPNPYDRPIEGVVVTIDMNRVEVVDVRDTGVRPVNKTLSGDAATKRPAMKPLVLRTPNGPEFDLTGNHVKWQGWDFRIGFNQREGLVLHQIGYDQGAGVRSIAYRLALDEIYVPYALPDPNWSWHAAMDIGEYNLGQYSEALQRGVDVPDNAVFVNEAVPGDLGTAGHPQVTQIPNAVAIYERPTGAIWDRTDPITLDREAHQGRELVVTNSVAIGNYTYMTDYVFGLDGKLSVVEGATGTTLNRGVNNAAEGDAFGTLVAPFIAAPAHQHFFNFRIDMDVDGTKNRVVEANTASTAPAGGNGFQTTDTTQGSEGSRDLNPATNRHWIVESSTRTGALGDATGYALEPLGFSKPYSAPDYPSLQDAAFAQHGLWMTRFSDAERFAAGDYPNQGPSGSGLPQYVSDHAAIDGRDVVLWHTVGFTHDTRTEDFPVMDRESVGFSLAPHGFFDQNPALDLP
ncbi:MAG: primary-amine oxidase [Thermoleophilales bacterium]|nr:primary-amine oxidase [Thermoleophilales bacterium]